jgi:glycosyltransferase involved in cell wall biosynthesis
VPLSVASSRPMRVLITSDAVGGIWSYTLELTRYLNEHSVDVQICILGPRPSAKQWEDAVRAGAQAIDVTGLPLDWTASSEQQLDHVADELKSHAQKWHADVVHLNAPGQAGTRGWEKPLVVTTHSCVGTWWAAVGAGPIPPDLAWRVHRTAIGMVLADAVIVPSGSFARDLHSLYGADVALTPIYNGRASLAVTSEKAPGDNIALTAGRLWDVGKNVRIVDDAAWISGQEIYGAGPMSGPNGESIELSSLRYLGSLDTEEMNAWQQRAAIFVSMSKYEPFGLAVLEAAQSRAALVLSDIPTFRELWDGAALFVDPDDSFALAGILRYLTTHPFDRIDLARAAEIRAAHYSAERMGTKTLDTYESVLSAARRNSVAQGVHA